MEDSSVTAEGKAMIVKIEMDIVAQYRIKYKYLFNGAEIEVQRILAKMSQYFLVELFFFEAAFLVAFLTASTLAAAFISVVVVTSKRANT